MPSSDGESSQDFEPNRLLHPRPSSSFDHGRALVPMWDSSDPERAPPPLPLNPQSPCQSRPNTSSTIQAHHAALTDKAREIGYNTISSPERRRNDTSPDKALIKSALHKRIQPLQTGHVRDISSFIETTPSTPISPEKNNTRPVTPHNPRDYFVDNRFSDKENTRPESPTPSARSSLETPQLRPSLRRPRPNILGETSSPQSATMVAMSTMSSNQSEGNLRDSSIGSDPMIRQSQTFDAISTQILGLTSIATNLQREMAALSRRSKDNATDLVSLKQATHSRDEDIRKSLRELVYNFNESSSRATSAAPSSPYLLDNKPHTPSSNTTKTISLPRIPSPKSFNSFGRESTPSYAGQSDSGASIVLLERVLRDMGTKEGQDQLVSRLTCIAERLSNDGVATAKRLEDLVQYIKENSNRDRALLAPDRRNNSTINNPKTRDSKSSSPPRLELDFDQPRSGPLVGLNNKDLREGGRSQVNENLLSHEILKVIYSTKDSVTQGGGLTAEVKALVRELRGEVLGMGRDIGRKLEEVDNKQAAHDTRKDQERIAQIVLDGLTELKKHMDRVTKDSQRRSLELVSAQTPALDGQEVYNAVKHALVDHKKSAPRDQTLTKDEIIDAVKVAWETYQPDRDNYPEREEIITWIHEGMVQSASSQIPAATRDEVFAAVVEGMKHYVLPQIPSQEIPSRDEIVDAVRECLEEFEFPTAPVSIPARPELTKDDVFEVVQSSLTTFPFPESRPRSDEMLSSDDVYHAVKTGLAEHPTTILDLTPVERQLSEIIGFLQKEFANAKAESLQDAATQAHNIEQLLEAYKQGTKILRDDIENFIEQAADTPSGDQLLETMKDGFAVVQAEVVAILAQESETSASTIKKELDDIRQSLASSLVPVDSSVSAQTADVLATVREGFERLSTQVQELQDDEEDVMLAKDEILETVHKVTEEIVSTMQRGISDLRLELDRSDDGNAMVLSDSNSSAELLTAFEENREAILGLQTGINELRHRSEQPHEQIDNTFTMTGELLEHVKSTRQELTTTLCQGLDDLSAKLDSLKDSGALTLDNNEDSSKVLGALTTTRDEILDGLRAGLDELRDQTQNVASGGDSILSGTGEILDTLQDNQQEIIAKVKEEIEILAQALVPSLSTNTERMMTALQDGLGDLRSSLDRSANTDEGTIRSTGEILDTFRSGLESVRNEVEKLSNRPIEPLDQTLNYEILDTLKQGLESLRADMDKLHERHVENVTENRELADSSQAIVTTDNHSESERLQRKDIDNLEVLITQLGIKVAAAESMPNPQFSAPTLAREDLNAVHEAINEVKASVDDLTNKAAPTDDGTTVRKEDIEAIETLLRNTKAKIDDMNPEEALKREHLDVVEEIMREANIGISDLLEQFDETSRKEDLVNVETLVKDIANELAEVKDRIFLEEDVTDKVTKTDVEAVEAVCHDIKAQIEQTVLTEFATLASKVDIDMLEERVKEFQTKIDANADSVSHAMEERQAEIVGIGSLVNEVKAFLEGLKDTMHKKFDQHTIEIGGLEPLLTSLRDKMECAVGGSKEILEALSTEFEKSHAGVVGAKLESDEQFQDIAAKFETKFDELLEKYNVAQAAADTKNHQDDELRQASTEAVTATKTVAEDIKIMVDVFGTKLDETSEKLDDSNTTVLDRVNETFTLVEEAHIDAKSEQQLTREQIGNAISAIEGIQGTISSNQPAILESIKEVLTAVGQHYEESKVHLQEFRSLHEQNTSHLAQQFSQHVEDSKAATQTLQAVLEARPASSHSDVQKLIEGIPTVDKYDDSQVHEKLDKFDAQVHTKLDQIIGNSYNDEHIVKKLDDLVEQMKDAAQSVSTTALLEEIHSKILSTSVNVSALMATQTLRITQEHEEREQIAAEASLALQQRTAQKEIVESEILRLRQEEDDLRESVMLLKADHANLSREKLQLSREVSGLDAALRIRREELHAMEVRAEGLERRIMEGVIDHSRALLVKKSISSTKTKKKDPMSLKRVPSQAVNAMAMVHSNGSPPKPKIISSTKAVDMAMSRIRIPPAHNKSIPSSPSRRILSLSQITGNAATGGLGRSPSVRTKALFGAARKSSWAAGTPIDDRKAVDFGELNKENLALRESAEERAISSDEASSDAGTMRRSSIGRAANSLVDGSEYTESEYTESSVTGTDWTVTDLDQEHQENALPHDDNGHMVMYEG